MLIKGKNLNSRQVQLVKSAFVHRHTIEHKANHMKDQVPTQTDKEWIESKAFHFVKDGTRLMSNRSHCEPEYMAD